MWCWWAMAPWQVGCYTRAGWGSRSPHRLNCRGARSVPLNAPWTRGATGQRSRGCWCARSRGCRDAVGLERRIPTPLLKPCLPHANSRSRQGLRVDRAANQGLRLRSVLPCFTQRTHAIVLWAVCRGGVAGLRKLARPTGDAGGVQQGGAQARHDGERGGATVGAAAAGRGNCERGLPPGRHAIRHRRRAAGASVCVWRK